MEAGGAESSGGSTIDPVNTNTKVDAGQTSSIELAVRTSDVAQPKVAVTRKPTYPQE
jgi:hypothetical protein